ncbi:hypothetical protein BCM14_2620 [Jezberella montanilacus]|uniref:Uncharacterized protein n=1 Tax=Jezberella montanilacus TaxID=323426 RepID=A0A2T0XD49_9BURK|nr:hypothetical protein [Jezberella montanilacus]PRY96863.1 hypothetical protein BCM14_2620 [Jezberella montanilacus]
MVRSYRSILNARSEVIEARIDTRVAEMKADLEAMRVDLRRSADDFKETATEIGQKITNLKYIVVTTAAASVIGLYAANVATMQALLSAYDSGKAMATVMAQTTERIQRTSERLDLLEARLEKNSTR